MSGNNPATMLKTELIHRWKPYAYISDLSKDKTALGQNIADLKKYNKIKNIVYEIPKSFKVLYLEHLMGEIVQRGSVSN